MSNIVIQKLFKAHESIVDGGRNLRTIVVGSKVEAANVREKEPVVADNVRQIPVPQWTLFRRRKEVSLCDLAFDFTFVASTSRTSNRQIINFIGIGPTFDERLHEL